METCEEPTFPGFEIESPSCQPACPASRPPLPGSAEARAMTVGSGRQLSMLFETLSPLGAFSKILLESSAWTRSEEYCYVWNRLDTKFALSAFQLTPLEQSTDGNESSLLPTPRATDGADCPSEQRRHTPCLEAMVKLWPTPTVPNGGRRNPEGTSITGKKPDGGKAQIDIREFAIRMIPTPTAMTNTGGQAMCKWGGAGVRKALQEIFTPEEINGSLNPRFVEELMGFPIDHTALKRSATPSSRSRLTRSSRRSRKPCRNS